jgi:hypothetical protein
MSKPSVRQNILLRSVQKLLGEGEQVRRVVLLSTRHRWFLPYAIASGIGLFVVASATGIESQLNRTVLAVCGIAIAGMAATNYSILAETTTGLVLCRSSRVRQYAKEVVHRLPAGTSLIMVGSTVITSDWKVDGVIYTLTKRWEGTMRQLSTEWA